MTYDVAIVGAGPSGAWAARSAARRGARVLLLDPSHPREKPCGGGLTGRALELVADAVPPGTLAAVTVRSARFSTEAATRSCEVPLATGSLSVTSRLEFDALIMDAARQSGADFVAARVTDVRRQNGGFEIATTAATHHAARVVGADGANSLVRRKLGARLRRDQLSIATGFFAHGVTSEEILVEFVSEPPGYLWSFPRPGHLAIGICAQADPGVTPAGLREVASAWMTRTGIAGGARLEPYSWPIPSLSANDLEQLQPAGPGWLLVGDAAGLVDPLTREGIYFALRSAEWAAEALSSGDPRMEEGYSRRVRAEAGAELARAARLKDRFFRPHFTKILIDALRGSASVRTVMADLVSGQQGYGDLKWRLLKTLQLGLAARFFVR